MYLVAPAAEFRNNILGQKLCIAASDIRVHILHMQKTVQYVLKFRHHLNLVQQYIVHSFIFHCTMDVFTQHIRVTVFLIDPVI